MTLRVRLVLLLAGLLSLLCLSPARADLDVDLPPGTPMDWLLWRPTGVPSPDIDAALTWDPAGAADGESTAEFSADDLDNLSNALLHGLQMNVDPWAASGVTTIDIPVHCPWFADKMDQSVTPAREDYKPALSDALRFNMLGQFVRVLLYGRARLSVPETAVYLIGAGQPAHFAARAAAHAEQTAEVTNTGASVITQPDLTKWVSEQTLIALGDPAGPLPQPEHADNPFGALLNRVLVEDLGAGYAYEYDPRYMHRLQSLGPVMVPRLIEVARDYPHSLLQRNAVAALDNYYTPEVLELFREILEDGDDRVMQLRALVGLVRRKDRASGGMILRQFKATRSLYWQCALAWGLSALGGPEAADAVADWTAEGVKNARREEVRDYFWTGLAALARMGANSKQAQAVCKDALDRFGDKGDPVHQLALLAFAAGGDRNAQKALKQFIGDAHLLAFAPGATGVAMDVLKKLQPTLKENYLRQAAEDKRVHALLRYHAIRILDCAPADAPWLEALARGSDLAPVRAGALLQLWKHHKPRALALAREIVAEYCAGKRTDGYEALFAARLLMAGSVVDHGTLLALAKANLGPERARRIASGTGIGGAIIYLPVPLLETVLPFLGRKDDLDTTEFLLSILKDERLGLQGLAARVLRKNKREAVRDALLDALDSDDPWLRFWAADSLSASNGLHVDCDWYTADPDTRRKKLKEIKDKVTK